MAMLHDMSKDIAINIFTIHIILLNSCYTTIKIHTMELMWQYSMAYLLKFIMYHVKT